MGSHQNHSRNPPIALESCSRA